MRWKIISTYLIWTLIVMLLCQSCLGWGDMFESEKHIIGPYYLKENEAGQYEFYYAINTDYFIGRLSGHSISAYAVKDSLIIVKAKDHKQSESYFVLNMNIDSLYREQKEVYIDTVPAESFRSSWIGKLNLEFTTIKD